MTKKAATKVDTGLTEETAQAAADQGLLDTPTKPLTRDEMRAILLGKTPLAKSVTVHVFDMDMDIRQPSFKDMMSVREQGTEFEKAAEMIIKYAYVPGTDEKLFEETDRELILRWPFGPDLIMLQEAIADLTGIDIAAGEAKLGKDPLDVSS